MKKRRNLSSALILILLGLLSAYSGCGYRVRSSVGSLPQDIQSLGVPTFQNFTTQYKLEQWITSAVLNEFHARTRIPVNSQQSGVDAVLLGEINSVSSTPVTFGPRSFGSAYMVTMQASAKLVRQKDSKILWQNSRITFKDRYALNADVKDFFSEENPALERIASDFAESLVTTIIESHSIDSSKP